jgi:AcrR family transcriptional regulator
MTRGAPYRHFPDKESLLIAVGTQAWDKLGEQTQALRADPGLTPAAKLRGALLALIDVGRRRPHPYKLMFSNPPGDPAALARAAQLSQNELLAILAGLVGEENARHYGALLVSTANGIAGMEVSGQLTDPKWGNASAEGLIETFVTMIADTNGPGALPTTR